MGFFSLSLLVFGASGARSPAATTVSVSAGAETHPVNPLFMGCHSDSGFVHQARGFYSQLIFGESFESSLPNLGRVGGVNASPTGRFNIVPPSANDTAMRHCSYQLYATPLDGSGPGDDFNWDVISALNGDAAAVSLRSVNFPTKYVQQITAAGSGVEPGRLGVSEVTDDKDAASFTPVAGDAPNTYMFKNVKSGGFISRNSQLSGSCSKSYAAPASDLVLASGAALVKTDATWTLVKPPVPPTPWSNYSRGDSIDFEAAIDASVAFQGSASQRLLFKTGSGVAGVVNRGIGAEGLYIEANRDYEGFFFARTEGSDGVKATVELQDRHSKPARVLAMADIAVPGTNGAWVRVNFSLTTSDGTDCVDAGDDPVVSGLSCGKKGSEDGHVCVSCGGQALVGLAAPGKVWIDYVFLQPGEWGRFKGLPVLRRAVENLRAMGITAIRQGGSFTDPDGYFWKKWRGAPWERESLGWSWYDALVGGWGPFEMIDMCNAAGIEPIITTSAQQGTSCCAPDDMADLVEYMWGNETTEWGRVRAQNDSHPEPYRARYIELGNEQYNSLYVDQVKAMEARATSLGMEKELYYIFPNNGKWLNDEDGAKAEAMGLGKHLVSDIHDGGTGGVEISLTQFAAHPTWTEATGNAETNAGTHTMSRALSEASDLNDYFGVSDPAVYPRLLFRTASFCTERSGHYDNWDQGMSFFLPNATWLQPPGFVHQMISQTWQPRGARTNLTGDTKGQSVSAQLSEDGNTFVVRYVNSLEAPVKVTITADGFNMPDYATLWTLASDDLDAANSPANLNKVAPVQTTVEFGTAGAQITVPEYSFSVLEISQ